MSMVVAAAQLGCLGEKGRFGFLMSEIGFNIEIPHAIFTR